jgi:cytidylate kinase/Zn-dependent peptidase ImmA (M78 family)
MKLGEFGVGKITKQNATKDAPIGSEYSNVKKLGLGSGKPKIHNKKATKNSDPNTLFNLGIGEGVDASSLKPFVKFCIQSLELKSVPKIVITNKKLDGTFGYYNTATKTLTVSLNDRHEADVMRTLAHELVHLAQDEQNQDIDGSDGSKHENQANAVAGVIMRKWADKDPSLFETPVQELKIEKPDAKDTLGVKRKDMPQVKSDDYAEFIEYLKKNGATFTKETIPARDLKAMQKEFSDEGIMKQLMKNIEQGPNRKAVIASSDDYIMDGHHRWLVAINTGRDLNVFRVNLPAYELYDLVNKFEKTYYKDIYNERGSIGVPLASGLVMSLFPHRPLKIKKSTPGKLRYDETITTVDLQQLETFADKLFAKVGIDVEFTRHFLDRVNDERNKKPITMAELTRLFKQEFKRWAKPIAQMGPGQEAVMKDLQTDINLPFALQYDKDNNELDLIAKTVMRKKDFKTPNREFPVEGWSAKYKKSINCSNPKGFSQKAHCAGKKKNEEDSKDTLGSRINFPGFEKKEKPKYKPISKKDKSILDKVKSWFTDDINEGYKLRLENDEDLLVLHIRNTRTGERAEVRGNPNYEIDYDENDELHQLLDVIGKASNISELMNGKIVSVNPKHPDGPKSYAALDDAMNEDDASDKVYELLLDNIGAGPFDGGCVVVAQALQKIHGGELMALVRNDGTADHAVVQKGNTMYDFDGPGTQEEVVSRFEKNEGTRIAEVRKLRMTDLPDAPRNSELAKQIASLMKEPVQEAQVDEGVNDPHIFKAVFLAGGPGSGKSFVAKNILGGTGLRSINSDEVYEFLMKKQGLSLDSETIFSPQGQEIRDKAKGLSRRREATYLDGRIGLIIDGTGKDVSKYQVMAQKLRAIGYDLSMIYVNTSLEVAQQRNKQRERSIKPAEVEKMWNDVQQNLMQFQQIFGADRFHIIDNSGGLEDLDRQKNFDKVYVETQRFLNTPPKNRKALAWIQKQKEQNDGQRSAQQPTTNQEPDGGTTASN